MTRQKIEMTKKKFLSVESNVLNKITQYTELENKIKIKNLRNLCVSSLKLKKEKFYENV